MYYRVQQNVRGMIPIHQLTVAPHPREPIAWYLCYRYVGDRATCEAIAEAMEIELERPELPDDDGEPDVLLDAAAFALENDVVPAIENPFAASRANDVKVLLQCADRRQRFGPTIDAAEVDELGALLGSRPATKAEGLVALDRAIADGSLDDGDVVRYLARRAYRDEWVNAPAVALYPDRQWAALD